MNATPPPGNRPTQRAQRSGDRLRWGITGLGAILLLVMVAAAGLRPTGREQQPGTGEPLAVLGVAPGPATRPDGGDASLAPAPAEQP